MDNLGELEEKFSKVDINDSIHIHDGNKCVYPTALQKEDVVFESQVYDLPGDYPNLSITHYQPQTQSARGRRKARDPTWLQVEVCREFLRGECNRSPDECRFAHPRPHCIIDNGKVTTCYDSLKSRCNRERCKYFHPPNHIKQQIQYLGKSFQQYGRKNIHSDMMINGADHSYGCQVMPPYSYYWYNPWNILVSNSVYGITNHIQQQQQPYGYYGYLNQSSAASNGEPNMYESAGEEDNIQELSVSISYDRCC